LEIKMRILNTKKISLFWLCTILILASCDSDDTDAPQGAKEFPRGTEWVGVLDRSGHQYAPPANLQFREDDNLVVYAPHFFFENNTLIRVDSVKGTIVSVTEVDNTTMEVVTSIEHYGRVTMTIKERKNLTSISDNANKPIPFTMEYYESTEPSGDYGKALL
jgi:hypothetical protein